MADTTTAADYLRTVRSFIGATYSNNSDQTYAGTDGTAFNPPAQYQSIGPGGAVGVEGKPISNAQTGALVMSAPVLIIGALVVAWLVFRKG